MLGAKALGWIAGALIRMWGAPGKRTLCTVHPPTQSRCGLPTQ